MIFSNPTLAIWVHNYDRLHNNSINTFKFEIIHTIENII